MCLENDVIRQRAQRFHAGEAQSVADELEQNAMDVLGCWEYLHNTIGMYSVRRHCNMAHCLLQWQVHIVTSWHKEVRALCETTNKASQLP